MEEELPPWKRGSTPIKMGDHKGGTSMGDTKGIGCLVVLAFIFVSNLIYAIVKGEWTGFLVTLALFGGIAVIAIMYHVFPEIAEAEEAKKEAKRQRKLERAEEYRRRHPYRVWKYNKWHGRK